jgi:cytochrome c6
MWCGDDHSHTNYRVAISPDRISKTMALSLTAAALSFSAPLSNVDASKVAAVSAAAALTIAATPVLAADAGAGENIFSGNCAACHAGGQNVIMPEKTLELDALKEYLDGGANEAAVVKQVNTLSAQAPIPLLPHIAMIP